MKRTLILALCLICFAGLSLRSAMVESMARFVYAEQDLASAPHHHVGIVFGAAVNANGSLSAMLADRVAVGVTLYQHGQIDKLLMSGDNGSTDYDEVSAMKRAALAAGVPSDAIVLDYAGFSTYDSCYRAKAIFGLSDAILITQNYHITRALYLCRSEGINAIGIAVEDFNRYPNKRVEYTVREFGASMKALWDVTIARPEPKYLGKFEGPL